MSATRPCASTWPRSTMATLVHSSSSSGRMWLLIRIVLPRARSSRRSSRSSTLALRVQPRGGFVEQQDLRVMDERVGQA